MKLLIPALILAMLGGCQQVNTTQGGTVGATRKQNMSALLSSEQVEQMSAAAYQESLAKGAQKGVLLPSSDPLVIRVRKISDRIIPHVSVFRPEAANWKWKVNVEKNSALNAYCMDGGKIMFYSGIIEKLKLNDDEIAQVMGHEISHALREHSRERMSEAYTKQLVQQGVSLFTGGKYDNYLGMADQVVGVAYTLPNSRTHESEADMMGLELAARAGYKPQASVTLWQKMAAANVGAPPEFLSTHPSNQTRIAELQAKIIVVQPLYDIAKKNPVSIAKQSNQPKSGNQNSIAALPFVGSRYFNLIGEGAANEREIVIQPDGETIIREVGNAFTNLTLYTGKFTNPIVINKTEKIKGVGNFKINEILLIKDGSIFLMDKNSKVKISKDCLRKTNKCYSPLNESSEDNWRGRLSMLQGKFASLL